MYEKFLLFLFLSLSLTAGWREEPEPDLYHLSLGVDSEASVAMGIRSAEVTINGYANKIDIGINGKYDSCTLSDDFPEWMTVTENPYLAHRFYINVSELNGSESRIGKVNFSVTKGKITQSGSITVTQNPCTLEDLQKTERRAMKKYLSKFDVIDRLPAIDKIQVGSVAPFYQMTPGGTVYMQVVRMGTSAPASSGETINFRYLRYNLLNYLETGKLPTGEGNGNTLTESPSTFELGSTSQWGAAIQMPLLAGLPADCEVNLVIASSEGPTAETAAVTPYLYNIRYLP